MKRRKRRETLCLINTDIWVPFTKPFIHLNWVHEDQQMCLCAGVQEPRPFAMNRPPSPQSKEIGLKIGKLNPIK